MPDQEKPTNRRHYFELPLGINNMSDAEIATLADELAKRIMSAMPGNFKKDEKGEKE